MVRVPGPDRDRDEQLQAETERARHRQETAENHETISRLRDAAEQDRQTIGALRDQVGREASLVRDLEGEARAAERIAAAQRALISQLRAEAGEATDLAAAAGERLRAAEAELVDLRAIRDALLSPTLVQRDQLTIAAEMFPAEPYVGGDFYYVGDGPRGTAVLAVGDVVGKGIEAARRAAFTRTVLTAVAGFSDDPCQLLGWVNAAMVEHVGESADFVTAICMTINPATRRLRVACAGHHPALRLSSGEELTGLRTGMALGLASELGCDSGEVILGPGDGALMFTDGLLETRGADGRFGSERVREAVARVGDASPDRIISGIKAELDRFADGEATDDVCLLALRTD
jgi:serine phosphatase RsbU (regulator of sigma subunit)